MKTVDIKRKEASRLLESIMQAVAEDINGKTPSKLASRPQEVLNAQGLVENVVGGEDDTFVRLGRSGVPHHALHGFSWREHLVVHVGRGAPGRQ